MELLGNDTIRYEFKKQEIKKAICADVCKLPDFRGKKMNMDLLNAIMNMIECTIKKKYEINKKYFLLEIFEEVFGKLSEDEKVIIGKNIEFIIKSGNLKKFTRLEKLYNSVRAFFRK